MEGFADINRYGLFLMVLGPMFISRMIRKSYTHRQKQTRRCGVVASNSLRLDAEYCYLCLS